jgi:hypothetical protein
MNRAKSGPAVLLAVLLGCESSPHVAALVCVHEAVGLALDRGRIGLGHDGPEVEDEDVRVRIAVLGQEVVVDPVHELGRPRGVGRIRGQSVQGARVQTINLVSG